jgi:hypothetical protein
MRNALLFVYSGFLGKGKQLGHWHLSFRIDIQSNTTCERHVHVSTKPSLGSKHC